MDEKSALVGGFLDHSGRDGRISSMAEFELPLELARDPALRASNGHEVSQTLRMTVGLLEKTGSTQPRADVVLVRAAMMGFPTRADGSPGRYHRAQERGSGRPTARRAGVPVISSAPPRRRAGCAPLEAPDPAETGGAPYGIEQRAGETSCSSGSRGPPIRKSYPPGRWQTIRIMEICCPPQRRPTRDPRATAQKRETPWNFFT